MLMVFEIVGAYVTKYVWECNKYKKQKSNDDINVKLYIFLNFILMIVQSL